jgi:sugar transferase (PEP-CTERM/EpsH1 system associated)
MSRELRRFRPCVVHTRNWAGIDGILAARMAGIRTVLHGEHGWDVGDLHGTSRRRRILRRFLSGFTAGFTCVSRHIASWLNETVRIRCPLTQIYNGVDTGLFRPGADGGEVRQELGIPPGALLVGHVGRLVAVKNHDGLFRAFDLVRRELDHTMLVCIGQGPRESELRGLAGPGVRMLGDRADVARLLRALDLFVLPSLNEGISNTILEAMATGLPVVATDVGGNSELVADGATGTLVPLEDEDGLARAIRSYLVDDGRRREHGERARETVLARFGLDRMVRSYEGLWRDCAGS